MRVRVLRKHGANTMCHAELEIRGDVAHGATFKASLNEFPASRAVEFAHGVVFVAEDGTRYEGSVQHGFHVPQYGFSLEGTLQPPLIGENRNVGCRLFLSSTGLSGVALGIHGDRTGWLYDYFVRSGEDLKIATKLLEFAMSLGAQQLVTYEHPFLELFFLRAGFTTRLRVPRALLKDPPADWIPDAVGTVGCPDFLCMVRSDNVEVAATSMASDLDDFASRPGTTTEDTCCARCRTPLPKLRWLGVLEGYHCRECRFLEVRGMLALSPWDRADSSSMITRSSGSPSRAKRTVFTSGAELLGA